MKTLIIFGTKYGTAEKCSRLLKDKLQGEVTVVNVKKDSIPDLSSFGNVIIGGSIYAGHIQKEIKNFCLSNLNGLKGKRVGLFICGINDKDPIALFNNYFPEELLNNATAKEFFGGEVTLKKMNFLERFIMKKIGKTDKDISKISEDGIKRLADTINKL